MDTLIATKINKITYHLGGLLSICLSDTQHRNLILVQISKHRYLVFVDILISR